MAGIQAYQWLELRLEEWLGETRAGDRLAQGVDGNISSEMGLELCDLADVCRKHPAVVDLLQRADNEWSWEMMRSQPGGEEAAHRLQAYEQALLARLAETSSGTQRVAQALPRLATLKAFLGFREYPKYHIVCRLMAYKRALMKEIGCLVEERVLDASDDAYFLSFDELRKTVRTRLAPRALIEERKREHTRYLKLFPPRVITSDGDVFWGEPAPANCPPGALIGLGVSSGVVEGNARVLATLEGATFHDEDILVTTFTDPSWTPCFVAVRGLVTEVGGLMNHGVVIAREYGLPAVVGVPQATRRIRNGQRIRVDGRLGLVELL